MKNVLIDLTQLPLERTGVGVYAVNYVRSLRRLAGLQRLHFLVLDDDPELLRDVRAIPGANAIVLKAALFRRFALRVLLEQCIIPFLAFTRGFDAVHSLHYSFPLCSFGRFKRIVTVCDMSFFLFPGLHVPVKRLFFRFFIRRLPKVEGLLFISASTMQDFMRDFPQCRAARRVMPLGADLARLAQAPDAALVQALRARFGIDRYILYVGTVEPRKNILGLVQAFERCAAAHPGVKLVIAGKLGWDYENLLQYLKSSAARERIVLAGYVNEAEKHALLKSALLFAYVSFYEGFGLPVLEGMAAGVATITSNISSMPEVAGDGALQVDPNDTAQIAAAMHGLLADPAARTALAARGLAQSRAFTWENTTAVSLDFYQEVLERNGMAASLQRQNE
ncbi:MAG TPA: glycosyltransferase family 1 protein [Noviherbaspirillum sp.]|uniref:glycosyltransferase family 4 protein n=1 Tax=Noviherbaspirillum sp. TaxID=1926288 RepID=UPI002D744F9B|nr:glycosyltransferase family 1 protein [Noviherbaspirillum sp.]HYD95591.1 glycosyltransferase family 1 protein [Noviherbaspirillum sp.]